MRVYYFDSHGVYRSFVVMCKIRAILNGVAGLIMLPFDLQYVSWLAQYQNAAITMDSYKKLLRKVLY